MKLSELFDQLAYGELAQIAIGSTGTIQVADYPKMVAHVNLALTELHKRFSLRTEQVFIQQHAHIAEYRLHSKYASSNTASTEKYKYVVDSVYRPFNDNILMIEEVYNEVGQEVPLNDKSDPLSVFTLAHDTIQYPYVKNENAFSVIYRADHERITIGAGFDPATTEIRVPGSCVLPLILFIAHRTFAAIGSVNEVNESNNYLSKFEVACQRIIDLGLIASDIHETTKLTDNGWV